MQSHHWLMLIIVLLVGYFIGIYWRQGAAMLKLPGVS